MAFNVHSKPSNTNPFTGHAVFVPSTVLGTWDTKMNKTLSPFSRSLGLRRKKKKALFSRETKTTVLYLCYSG